MKSENEIIIYTDGAALGNPGPGGYGAVLIFNGKGKEISDAFRYTTNNRMELLAIIKALSIIKEEGFSISIYTDSQYVRDAVEKKWVYNWKKKGWAKVKNVDLWKDFLVLYEKHQPKIHWVKGHAGNHWNERCDVLANTAAKSNPTKPDTGYENVVNQKDNNLFE